MRERVFIECTLLFINIECKQLNDLFLFVRLYTCSVYTRWVWVCAASVLGVLCAFNRFAFQRSNNNNKMSSVFVSTLRIPLLLFLLYCHQLTTNSDFYCIPFSSLDADASAIAIQPSVSIECDFYVVIWSINSLFIMCISVSSRFMCMQKTFLMRFLQLSASIETVVFNFDVRIILKNMQRERERVASF